MPLSPGHEAAEITDVRRCGPGLKRRGIALDGESWREVPAAVYKALEIEVGDSVDRDELSDRIDTTERPLARERALRLLTARERSCAGLIERLIEDGYSAEAARDTAGDLVRIGLVDDARFAHAMARTMANARGIGRSGIARELRSAGVDETIATDALDEALGAGDEESAARRLAMSAAAKSGATVDRVAARLIRRGYRTPLALSVAREAMASVSDGAEGTDPCDVPFRD